MNRKQFCSAVEQFAPLEYAYDWDNSGMTLALHDEIKRILVCLDVTEQVIAEAVEQRCDTIVSHHPLVFRAVKKFDRSDPVGGVLIAAIQHGINLYAAHTSFDCAPGGINDALAQQLGLENIALLQAEKDEHFCKVVAFAPPAFREQVESAMFEAGAGSIGKYYDKTSFIVEGNGFFRPLEGAKPAIGAIGKREKVAEARIECICPMRIAQKVLAAAQAAHPYEQPVIDVYPLALPKRQIGIGSVGDLPVAMQAGELAQLVRERLNAPSIKLADAKRPIQRVACVGGAGGEFYEAANRAGAQALITGEAKYNHFIEAKARGISLIEAGHFDTEAVFVQTMMKGLQKIFFAVQYNVDVIASVQGTRPYSVV